MRLTLQHPSGKVQNYELDNADSFELRLETSINVEAMKVDYHTFVIPESMIQALSFYSDGGSDNGELARKTLRRIATNRLKGGI